MTDMLAIKVHNLVNRILESPGQLEFQFKLEDDDLQSEGPDTPFISIVKEIKDLIKVHLPAYEPLWAGYCVKILWTSKDKPLQIYCNYWEVIAALAESRVSKDIITVVDHLKEIDEDPSPFNYLRYSYPPGIQCI